MLKGAIYRGYYTAARRYEVYFRVVKTIFYERAQRVTKILFLARENKIHIFKPPRNFLFIIWTRVFCRNNSVRAGNDVIDILTSEDMENTPLEFRMKFPMNFTSGLFSTDTLFSIQ